MRAAEVCLAHITFYTFGTTLGTGTWGTVFFCCSSSYVFSHASDCYFTDFFVSSNFFSVFIPTFLVSRSLSLAFTQNSSMDNWCALYYYYFAVYYTNTHPFLRNWSCLISFGWTIFCHDAFAKAKSLWIGLNLSVAVDFKDNVAQRWRATLMWVTWTHFTLFKCSVAYLSHSLKFCTFSVCTKLFSSLLSLSCDRCSGRFTPDNREQLVLGVDFWFIVVKQKREKIIKIKKKCGDGMCCRCENEGWQQQSV